MDDVEQAKKALRTRIRSRIQPPEGPRNRLDQAIVDRLSELASTIDWETILAFAPLPSEPQIDALIERWRDEGRRVLLPRVEAMPGSMSAVVLERPLAQLQRDSLGIRTPTGSPWQEDRIDLALVPGCAFDEQRNRLGRGGGYYDRFLADAPGTRTIGLCFEAQVVDRVPTRPHDRSVDLLVTEQRILGHPQGT